MANKRKRGPGRPPVETPRDYTLQVRLTDDERRAYELAAAAAKRSVSDYVCLVVGVHITTQGPPDAARALLPDG